MHIFDYHDVDINEKTTRLLETNTSFGITVNGWRARFIHSGLRYYLRYREAFDMGQRRIWIALSVIPFGFITPTFWAICIRAEINGMRPKIASSTDRLVVVFE